ncbi:thioredoxin family protein [Microbacterium petrolearium]|jgi:thiol-disulfide isomerase/thioredoxin
MSPLAAALILAGIVLVAVLLGLALRRGQGRARRVGQGTISTVDVGVDAGAFGERATLLQFSTEVCAKCPSTRRLLSDVASSHAGVRHVDVDLTHRPDLARRFQVLQTPTVLVLDGSGAPHARIGGAPQRSTVVAELERIGGVHA